MKIESASVSLHSQQAQVNHREVQEHLRVWRGNTSLDLSRNSRADSASASLAWSRSSVVTQLSQAAQALPAPAPAAPQDQGEPVATDPKLEPLIRLVELITGRKVRTFHAEDLQARAQRPADTAGQPQRAGWGLRYDRTETRYEAQHTQVQVEGVVHTRDGREIAFALSLEMHREYLQTSSVSLRAGDALLKDPLVIHFDGPAGELSDLRFDFDLDADGRTENLGFVGAGSGFLVLDHNGNGRVDNGRELFGALSGDGFADLAALDKDDNGWIDENDPAFARLQVWQKDAQGQDLLRGLQEAQVGALYLGRVASPFSVRDAQNQTLAEVRSTGVYLREDGAAGALQQIDLAV
ncbi:hypothetical protein [Hydrogenophaga sp. OTU3427]|uniref:hypothetical protein n=1 Tax=Hydrogenophaga sp. OTU3427 TaxID=3043856 RepID=UPI00313B63E4